MFSPGFESHRYIDNVEVAPGAVVQHDPKMQFRFSVQARCVTVNPDSWVGQLLFNGMIVAETAAMPSIEQATTATRQILTDKIKSLFA